MRPTSVAVFKEDRPSGVVVPDASEWVEWHAGYSAGHPRAQRLAVVQRVIREVLDRFPPGPIRVVSLCAGDGRALLGVLAAHPRCGDVTGRLIDLDPTLVEAGRRALSALPCRGLEFVRGDASLASVVRGAVPADLVLACGIFGNITEEDVHRTVRHLPGLCARGASVIWTRGRFDPDLTPRIRAWFREAGFEEVEFVPLPGSPASVGHHRLVGASGSPEWTGRLFTFLPPSDRPSAIAQRDGE